MVNGNKTSGLIMFSTGFNIGMFCMKESDTMKCVNLRVRTCMEGRRESIKSAAAVTTACTLCAWLVSEMAVGGGGQVTILQL